MNHQPLYSIGIATSAVLPVIESIPTLLISRHIFVHHLTNGNQTEPQNPTGLDLQKAVLLPGKSSSTSLPFQ